MLLISSDDGSIVDQLHKNDSSIISDWWAFSHLSALYCSCLTSEVWEKIRGIYDKQLQAGWCHSVSIQCSGWSTFWWWTLPLYDQLTCHWVFLVCPSAYRIIDWSSHSAEAPFCSQLLCQGWNYCQEHQGHVHGFLLHAFPFLNP